MKRTINLDKYVVGFVNHGIMEPDHTFSNPMKLLTRCHILLDIKETELKRSRGEHRKVVAKIEGLEDAVKFLKETIDEVECDIRRR